MYIVLLRSEASVGGYIRISLSATNGAEEYIEWEKKRKKKAKERDRREKIRDLVLDERWKDYLLEITEDNRYSCMSVKIIHLQ